MKKCPHAELKQDCIFCWDYVLRPSLWQKIKWAFLKARLALKEDKRQWKENRS